VSNVLNICLFNWPYSMLKTLSRTVWTDTLFNPCWFSS
jgi:hypothetical protein